MDPMVEIIAKRFIQRRDVKAQQSHSGAYYPVTHRDPATNADYRAPFMVQDIEAHLRGEVTYGHYLIDHDDTCKLFAFDIDLTKVGSFPAFPDLSAVNWDMDHAEFVGHTTIHEINPRDAWMDRSHPARDWLKYQMRMVAEKISRIVAEDFELPVVTAYSGRKGLHVYALTGPIKASEAREAAETVLALTGEFELFRGKNFYRHVDQDPMNGFPNVTVELFPKQAGLEGKDLGNLMRLPLGRNAQSPDPTFFIDQRAPMMKLVPHPDPIELLSTGRPWQ